MAKKKKKSNAGDARGYGQATVFREVPPLADTVNAAVAKQETKPTNNQRADDWDDWPNASQTPTFASTSSNSSKPNKIPPPANIQLPTLASKPSSVIVLSNKMHDLLQQLVEPLPWKAFVAKNTTARGMYPDRLLKKVAHLYDYLFLAGFTWHHIYAAVQALGQEPGMAVDVETTLDWLCTCLDTNAIPVRFLEGRELLLLQQQEREKEPEENHHTLTQEPIAAAQDTMESKDVDNDSKDKATAPKDENVSEQLEATENATTVLKKPLSDEEYIKTKDEERLEALEKDFAEVSAEYNDEASKYMMSKYEVKELEKRYNQAKKELRRLQEKVEATKERRRQEKLAATINADESEGGEGGNIFGGFFDEDPQETAKPQGPSVPATTYPYIKVPADAIPKSWTGQTPKEILEERCRRLKLPRPTFQTLDRNGCRIVIKDSIQVEELSGFDSKADGQHYVATKALYQLDPTLPIHRSLPPYFEKLWKGWASEKQNRKDEEERLKEETRKEQILELLSIIRSHDTFENEAENSRNIDDNISTCTKEALFGKTTTPSTKQAEESRRLQGDFSHRSSTKDYHEMFEQRTTLPIFAYRENILETVSCSSVTVLHAETGAGKTTQVPQFILEAALQGGTGASTSILCTQPRRVAATSIAERVSEEMGTTLGQLVGYSIRLENVRSSETRLLFCTTGVILRRLIEDPNLSGVSHVVVDEVHERQWQIDVLLVALRRLINGARPDLKVVLMSATLDAKLFCDFFHGAPLISVPGRTFPVSNYFLEDLVEATGHIVEDDSPNAIRNYYRSETAQLQISTKGGRERKQMVSLDSETDPTLSADFEGYSLETRRTMDRVDESVLNYDLIEDVLHLLLIERKENHMLKAPEGQPIEKGAVLIFLPGIGEIRTLCDRLQASSSFRDGRTFDIIPMHSALSSSEQRRAFHVPRKVRWAIIVCTNVAETSVTIPDAVCVIDSGRVREVRHDKRTNTRRLVTTWCSRASTKQRAGRAGRVQPGICLRLFSSRTSHCSMSPTTEPELQRLPLEEVCLTILAGRLAPYGCASFLSQTPQPPKTDSVQAALISLQQVGAITVPTVEDNTVHDAAESLTPLGLQLAKLPVDARLGKMLLLGVQFRCVDTITTIVAGLSASQSPFLTSLRQDTAALARQAKFRHENSDFMTLVNLYDAYIEAGETFSFCRDHYVSFSALREMKQAKKHYLDLLRGMQWLEKDDRHRNSNGQDEVVLHAVIASALSQMARIDRTVGDKDLLWHRSLGTVDQQVHVHKSSVNANLARRLPSRWLVFFEKFAAANSRVSISTTAYCSPLALVLLVGHDLQIQHWMRQVVADGWMTIGVSATVAVKLRALRNQLHDLHKEEHFVDGVVQLLKEDAAAALLWEPATTTLAY